MPEPTAHTLSDVLAHYQQAATRLEMLARVARATPTNDRLARRSAFDRLHDTITDEYFRLHPWGGVLYDHAASGRHAPVVADACLVLQEAAYALCADAYDPDRPESGDAVLAVAERFAETTKPALTHAQDALPKLAPEPETPGDEAPSTSKDSALGYEELAVAAAYAIQREGGRVSISAVCKRAGLNRSHLANRYPGTVHIIKQIGAPTRSPRRGSKGRDGSIEAIGE